MSRKNATHKGSGNDSNPAISGRPAAMRAPIRRTGRSWIPSLFIVFALLMLLAVPLWLERSVSRIRVDVLQPAQEARGIINDVRQAFSEAEASFRGYLLTGDPRLHDAMVAAHTAEAHAFAELRHHARQLDPGVLSEIERLARHSEEVKHRRMAAAEELPEQAPPGDAQLAVREHARLLVQSENVRAAVIAEIGQARARIRALETAGMLATLGLAVLALIAVLVVIVIGQRDRRTVALEAELRAAALTLAEATDVEEILRRIVLSAARTVSGSSSFVERIDEEKGDVVIVTTAGELAPPAGTRLAYPGSLSDEVVRSGTPETFRVASLTNRPSTAHLRAACEDCSAVVVPLISDDNPQGALVLLRRGVRRFRQTDLMQLRIFGVFAALALRKGVLLARAVEQQRQLERAARTRERMVRGFSHDLKNPLGAADGHAALLEEGVLGELAPRQREHVRRIRGSLQAALEIIGDVVELARAEAGQLSLRQEPLDPSALVLELAAEYEAAAAAAGLQLEASAAEDTEPTSSDLRRVRQILSNLLSNAIKYTPAGGHVRVSAERRQRHGRGGPGSWIAFVVEDDGPGIAPADLSRIFDEFQRLDVDSAPGTGLGLAISERLARLLGGELEVASDEGRGATFTLWLPTRRREAREAA